MLRLQWGVSSSCQLHRWICESVSLLQRCRHGWPPSHYHWQMNTVCIKTGTWPWHISAVNMWPLSGGESLGFWLRATGFWVWWHAWLICHHLHDLWPQREEVQYMERHVKCSRLSSNEIHNVISLQHVLVFADSSQVGATVVWRSGTSTMVSASRHLRRVSIVHEHFTEHLQLYLWKEDIFDQRRWHLQLCLWWKNQELKAKTFYPNRVIFVPQ